MGRQRGKVGFTGLYDNPSKKPRRYPDRRDIGHTWLEDDVFISIPTFTPEQNMWAALLCISVHESIAMVAIKPFSEAYHSAVKAKIASYRWIQDDRRSMGSLIWVLEQLDFEKWRERIQQHVKEHYVEQLLEPSEHSESLRVRRRKKRPASLVAELRSACRTPSLKKPPECVGLGCVSHPGVLLLPYIPATQNQTSTSSSDET